MNRAMPFLAILLLAGCSAPAEPLDCGDQLEHPFEARCVDDQDASTNEVCTMWLGDGVRKDESIFCHASSDGRATVHTDFTGSGHVTVYVRDPAGDLFATRTLGPGEHVIGVDGDAGRWRLVTDFSEATGPIRVQLWG